MNRQEILKKIEEKKNELAVNQGLYSPMSEMFSRFEVQLIAYTKCENYVQQLDEPQKPVVPQCFDIDYKKYKYMENNKSEILLTAMGGIHRTAFSSSFKDLSPDVWKTGIKWNKWTKETILWASRNYADFCQAVISGNYEVEKEPLYVVSLPGYNESRLAYDSVVEDYVIVDENFNDELGALRFELTEKEIKSKDERYWPFAVPVEEVTEG